MKFTNIEDTLGMEFKIFTWFYVHHIKGNTAYYCHMNTGKIEKGETLDGINRHIAAGNYRDIKIKKIEYEIY